MRKRISKYALVAILGISLAAPAVGFAHSGDAFPSGQWGSHGGWTMSGGMGPGMMHGMMGMGPGMMFGSGVTFTDEQQEKYAKIQNRFLKESVKPQTDLIRARAALQALLIDPSAKENVIEEQVRKSATAQARLFVLRIRAEREKEKLYTKEQREQMTRGSAFGPMGMMGTTGMGNPCAATSSRTSMGMR